MAIDPMLHEPDPVTCVCGHDLNQHTQGFFAPCNAEDCDCDDFLIEEDEEDNEETEE